VKRLAWIGIFCIAGCSALRQPVTDPNTGEPVLRPDGTEQTVYDQVTAPIAGLIGLFTGNPMWTPVAAGAVAAIREKVLGKKKPEG
jgi:hypothetical protein